MLTGHYSELKVLHSRAGYYVGTLFYDASMDGMPIPGSRESEYFRDPKVAEARLRYLQANPKSRR